MQHRFAPTAFFIWSGMLVWSANFLFIYVFVALACARSFAQVRLAGISIVPFASAGMSVLAGLATALLMLIALRRMRSSTARSPSRFIGFLTLSLSLLALIAVVWTALPPLLLRSSCAGT